MSIGAVTVLISGGFSGAYEQLLPEFERTTGIKVATGSGASQGAGPQTIAAQLARGVRANVVILSREGLSELIAAKICAACEVVRGDERRGFFDRMTRRRAQSVHELHAEADGAAFPTAVPSGVIHVDRQHLDGGQGSRALVRRQVGDVVQAEVQDGLIPVISTL